MNISSNQHTFFLVIPPGFEQTALSELGSRTDLKATDFHIETSLEEGFALNYQLRVPTRILLRLSSFKARDFPRLYNKVSKIPWRQWLWTETVDFHISCSESRLIHTSRIEKAANDAILKSLKGQPFQLKHKDYFDFNPQVYIRVHNDEVTVSIDTSYPPLYKRGVDKSGHQASLRENLAYGCWLELKKQIPGNLDDFQLIDPMCGSGSFLTEATELSQREIFSFQGFPISKKLKIEKPSYISPPLKCSGYDNHHEYIFQNKERFPDIQWECRDLFKTVEVTDGPNILIANPPYNKRIKTEHTMKKMLEQMINQYSPILLGIIVPKDQLSQVKDSDYKLIHSINFRNGGLPCQFMILKRD